jgi:hypothetical protein
MEKPHCQQHSSMNRKRLCSETLKSEKQLLSSPVLWHFILPPLQWHTHLTLRLLQFVHILVCYPLGSASSHWAPIIETVHSDDAEDIGTMALPPVQPNPNDAESSVTSPATMAGRLQREHSMFLYTVHSLWFYHCQNYIPVLVVYMFGCIIYVKVKTDHKWPKFQASMRIFRVRKTTFFASPKYLVNQCDD